MIYIAYAAAWLATGVSVCAGVYITKSAWCLLALLIPACIKVKDKEE